MENKPALVIRSLMDYGTDLYLKFFSTQTAKEDLQRLAGEQDHSFLV